VNPSCAEAIRDALARGLEEDDGLVLMGEGVGRSGGEAGTTAGLLARFGAGRVLDLPISDRATVALGAGRARAGAAVVVELSSSGRLPAALEALAEAAQVASDGELPMPLVIRVPCGHIAAVDQPPGEILADLDGLRVVCPADPATTDALLRAALRIRELVIFLEPRDLYPVRGPVGGADVDLGAARVLREGTDLCLVGWGTALPAALQAARRLEASGLSVGVVDLVSLVPLDRATLGQQLRQTGRLVVVDGGEVGGSYQVLRAGLDEAFLYLEAPMAIAPPDTDSIVDVATRAARY